MTALLRSGANALVGVLWLAGCGPNRGDAALAARPASATTPVATGQNAPPITAAAPSVAVVAPAPPSTAEPVSSAPSATPAATTEPAPLFVVRYACDDKYAAEAECRPGQAAFHAWLAGLQLTSGASNLLEHHGGGPSGAEWNPAAPLVAFALSTEPGRARLKLSGKHTLTPSLRWTDYDVFFVPSAAWNRASRPARASDLTDTAALDAIRVVELQAWVQSGQLAHGTFAFSGGE